MTSSSGPGSSPGSCATSTPSGRGSDTAPHDDFGSSRPVNGHLDVPPAFVGGPTGEQRWTLGACSISGAMARTLASFNALEPGHQVGSQWLCRSAHPCPPKAVVLEGAHRQGRQVQQEGLAFVGWPRPTRPRGSSAHPRPGSVGTVPPAPRRRPAPPVPRPVMKAIAVPSLVVWAAAAARRNASAARPRARKTAPHRSGDAPHESANDSDCRSGR